MSTTAPTTARPRHRLALAAATAVAAFSLGALPAAARQDPGERSAPTTTSSTTTPVNEGQCPLRRIGTQYVRCDNLTGNGVAAPAWVLER